MADPHKNVTSWSICVNESQLFIRLLVGNNVQACYTPVTVRWRLEPTNWCISLQRRMK